MPEEINRIATDSICDYWFVTEQIGLDNLLHYGCASEKIFFVGNTMIDSQYYALAKSENSDILNQIGLTHKKYALVTIHRPSNVDEPKQLGELLEILAELSTKQTVVFPGHPRTRKNIIAHGLNKIIEQNPNIKLIEPQGYIAFLALLKNSDFVMTDSGGIQEETTALGVPCLTIRTTTERPITCEIGTNILVEPTPEAIRRALRTFLESPRKIGQVPPLWDGKAAERIAEIIVKQCLGQ